MNADLLKTSGWTIAAAGLLLISFLAPLVAPLLLIWSLVAGLLGYFGRMGRYIAGGDNYYKFHIFW
jgi:hypothetical protein